MNGIGIIVFIFLGLIFNGLGMYIADTMLLGDLLHPSGIGFIVGIAAITISDVIGQIAE